MFDDAFSALDMKTDAKLRAALSEVTSDAVVLIVAQRVSTIKDAEQIVVLDNGKVVGKGRHLELLAKCKVYQEIVKSQYSDKEFAAEMRKAERLKNGMSEKTSVAGSDAGQTKVDDTKTGDDANTRGLTGEVEYA